MKFEIIIMDILAQLYLLKKKKKPDLDRHLSLHILIFQLILFIKVRSRKPVTEWSITLDVGAMIDCYCSL